MNQESLALLLSQGSLAAVNRDKHAPKGGIERARLEQLVGAGMTIAEIAAEVGLSKGTVRHWMKRHGLRTQNARGRRSLEAARSAREAGLLTTTMVCRRRGETEFRLEGRGHYRCKRCRSEAVVRRRRKVKSILVAEAGGCCCICGYARHVGALEFHHLDPAEKRLELSKYGVTLALESARAEARKCVLLCANCHAEVEGGETVVPIEFSR